jgi:hypothetical protein
LIMRRWMRNSSARAKSAKAFKRSFSRRATSSQISYATLAMAMSRNSSQEGHGWHSTRPAHMRGCVQSLQDSLGKSCRLLFLPFIPVRVNRWRQIL